MSEWTLKDIKTCTFSFILAVVGICAYASDPYDYKSLIAHEVHPVETARNAVGNIVVENADSPFVGGLVGYVRQGTKSITLK